MTFREIRFPCRPTHLCSQAAKLDNPYVVSSLEHITCQDTCPQKSSMFWALCMHNDVFSAPWDWYKLFTRTHFIKNTSPNVNILFVPNMIYTMSMTSVITHIVQCYSELYCWGTTLHLVYYGIVFLRDRNDVVSKARSPCHWHFVLMSPLADPSLESGLSERIQKLSLLPHTKTQIRDTYTTLSLRKRCEYSQYTSE